MSWSRVLKSAQAFAAHTFLLCFTLLLLLKLDHRISSSWWLVSFFFFLLFMLISFWVFVSFNWVTKFVFKFCFLCFFFFFFNSNRCFCLFILLFIITIFGDKGLWCYLIECVPFCVWSKKRGFYPIKKLAVVDITCNVWYIYVLVWEHNLMIMHMLTTLSMNCSFVNFATVIPQFCKVQFSRDRCFCCCINRVWKPSSWVGVKDHLDELSLESFKVACCIFRVQTWDFL